MYHVYSLPDTTHNLRFHRGFTSHEHYTELKIINMNGRLYDPVIARFFSPDNFVQAPSFTQSFNRYSYCLNNPLQYVDPSGEEIVFPWYKDFLGFVHWIGSVDDMPKSGQFLGYKGTFGSGYNMYYFNSDGTIDNVTLAEVIIHCEKSSLNDIIIEKPNDELFVPFFNIAGRTLSISSSELSNISNIYYNNNIGKWLGKNNKFYNMSFNGNGSTGGRIKFAQTRSKYFSRGSKILGITSSVTTFSLLLNSNSIDEKAIYTTDLMVDAIGTISGVGSLLSLYWYCGGRELHWIWCYNALIPQINAGDNPGLMIYQPFK